VANYYSRKGIVCSQTKQRLSRYYSAQYAVLFDYLSDFADYDMEQYQNHGGNYQHLTYYNVALLFHLDRQIQSLVLPILPPPSPWTQVAPGAFYFRDKLRYAQKIILGILHICLIMFWLDWGIN
jgi:hypothetical protein